MDEPRQKASEISRHPLVLLIVGTLIGSILIPGINNRMDRDRRLREIRETRGMAALDAGLQTERSFNLVRTEFESFYKDLAAKKTSAQADQALADRLHKAYQEFDRDAWWWANQARDEMRMLGLLSADRVAILDHAVEDYNKAVLESAQALDPYWDESVHSQTPITPDQAMSIMKKVSPGLDKLGERRRGLLEKIVQTIVY